MTQDNGLVFYEGPSQLDGRPIVGIATGLHLARRGENAGANRKTGAMVQTYILRQDISPTQAVRSGADASICGDCPHRGTSCYVRLDTGPLGVWKAYRRGRYKAVPCRAAGMTLAGLPVRVGTYGDPYAVPYACWTELLAFSQGLTGYTHQWRRAAAVPYQAFCMASCDTIDEAAEARALGWRPFTIVPATDWQASCRAVPSSFLCPASKEAGYKLTCRACLACDGAHSGRKAGVVIPVHGLDFKVKAFERRLVTIDSQR